jgi:hypothetical protein
MPLRIPVLNKKKGTNVTYRGANGRTLSATIIGPGSSSGAKLALRSRIGTGKIVDNVALATSRTQTNVYYNRVGP